MFWLEHLAPVMDENSPDPIQSAGLFEGDIAGVNASDINPVIFSVFLRWVFCLFWFSDAECY